MHILEGLKGQTMDTMDAAGVVNEAWLAERQQREMTQAQLEDALRRLERSQNVLRRIVRAAEDAQASEFWQRRGVLAQIEEAAREVLSA
jgi:hypothetical protein